MRTVRLRNFIAILAPLLVVTVYVAMWKVNSRFTPVSLKIEYSQSNDIAPCVVKPAPDGLIHVLVAGSQICTYDQTGTIVQRKQLKLDNVSDSGVLLTTPSLGSVYARTCGSESPRRAILWARFGEDGALSVKKLYTRSDGNFEIYQALSARDGVYVTGELERSQRGTYPSVVKLSPTGKQLWTSFEPSNSDCYDHVAVAADGSVVAAGAGGQQGTCIGMYSARGEKKWSKSATVGDGGSTVWLGARHNGAVLALVRLHDTIITGGSGWDIESSGRNQDYVLRTYRTDGHLVKEQILSHGPNLNVVDAALNDKDVLYLLCGRAMGARAHGDGSAVLKKYDSSGKLLWSGIVRVPGRCLVRHITCDNSGGIYITGASLDVRRSWLPRAQAFVYKVVDLR